MKVKLTLFLFLLFSLPLYGQEVRLFQVHGKGIKNLFWISQLKPFKKTIKGQRKVFVALKGEFDRPGWEIKVRGIKLKKVKTGSLLGVVPIDKERTRLFIQAFGPNKKKESAHYMIHFPSYLEYLN